MINAPYFTNDLDGWEVNLKEENGHNNDKSIEREQK